MASSSSDSEPEVDNFPMASSFPIWETEDHSLPMASILPTLETEAYNLPMPSSSTTWETEAHTFASLMYGTEAHNFDMASSSSSSVQQNHVYVSFRGEDTDNYFVFRLRAALERRGIDSFVDYQHKREEEISQALLTAIEKSKIFIIIVSKGYVSSSWCLDELSKIHECKNTNGQIVVPVLYHLDPSDVRYQTGSCEEAFAKYEERFKDNMDKVQRCRAALTEIANLFGFHLRKDSDEKEYTVKIARYVCSKLNHRVGRHRLREIFHKRVGHKNQVFISSSEETLNNFTSHLHAALERKGIDTFIDNKLERGEKISQAILTAIEESKISIIVFSKNYASSSWCLDELSNLLECEKRDSQIIPIFYHVHPSDVRKQKGSFEEAFAKYEERFKDNIYKVKRWRAALVEVRKLSSHYLQEDKPEAELIEDIVQRIWAKLNHELGSNFKGLVGMDSRIEELEKLLDGMESDGVRIIGIWGMPGVGKTTTADVFFKHISSQFDVSYFLTDVRQKSKTQGLQCVRNELLSKVLQTNVSIETPSIKGTFLTHRLRRRKVLIVLDDVSNSQQVEYLIGGRSCFGSESTIIITSRDKGALSLIADKIYMVEKLTSFQAFELFGLNAVRGGHHMPMKEDPNLLDWLHRYADGIPLALKILGSFLYFQSERTWKASLEIKYGNDLNMKIHKVLRISYDELESDERNIFLDVACFFEGEDRNHVTNILDGCGFFTEMGIDVLINKSLVTVSNNNLQMHCLIQEMGWQIVRQESFLPSDRSRLWIYKDISDILNKNKSPLLQELSYLHGTETIEGIFLDMSTMEETMYINPNAFLRMDKLRLLKIYNPHSQYKVLLQEGLNKLPDSLVYLHWQCYPLQSLPLKFLPRKLVELHIHYSHVIRLWEGTPKLPCLKWIDLSYSSCLKEMPDLSKARNLERINLVGCTSLLEIPSTDPSLPKLQEVYLSGCSNLKNFPLLSWNVKELHLDGTAIEEVPTEIQHFSRLIKLNMKNCKRLKNLPSIHGKLRSLEFLDLSGCSSLMNFPEISWNLKELLLNETEIEELPSSIEFLGNLVSLKLQNCMRIKYLPSSISKLKSLECLDLSGCSNLTKIPGNVNVKNLYLEGTSIEEMP